MTLGLSEVLQSKTPKIYKDKRLNNAHFSDFSHNDYQVFLHLITKIGGVDAYGKYLQQDQLQREHALTAKEFSKLFNVSLSNCYGILKKAVDRLMKADIRIEKPDNQGFWRINVCSMAEYNKKDGYISIKFTDDIMPYLAQVRQKFVLYNLKEIANFGSLYTTRLYELLQEFKETGWMLKSVDQLREVFVVGNKFKTYNNFKQKTFAHACQEINNNYDMGLRFEELKEGRKIVAVKFFFKQTVVTQVTNQKTGQVTNIYSKPKTQISIRKDTINDNSQKSLDILNGQLSFNHSKSGTKPIKNTLSSLFEKFRLSKK
jgi:plasmid replication initiation protein